MGIILDADVIIRGEKRTFNIATWLRSRADDEFKVAAITIAELWHGVERASGVQRAKRERFVKSIAAALPIVPYGERTALLHARLWAQLQANGTMIGYYDLIVAATALELDDHVATFNHRHFGVVPGLKVIKPA